MSLSHIFVRNSDSKSTKVRQVNLVQLEIEAISSVFGVEESLITLSQYGQVLKYKEQALCHPRFLVATTSPNSYIPTLKMKIENPAIPSGSVVVVIGANGYIGVETCHKVLEAGFRCRGTVRDVEKNAWMHTLFEKKWPGKFELVRVPDFTVEDAFDEAFSGKCG